MRAALLLALLLVILPAVSAAPGVCPDVAGALRCHDRLLAPGQDHLVVRAGDATVAYFEPGHASEEPPLHAGYERYAGDTLGEEVVVAELTEGYVPTGVGSVPVGWFFGTHFAPAGQDARVGTNSEWRSASAWVYIDAAGQSGHVGAGTFWFWGLQFYYVEGDVNGMGNGYFDALPLP